ncbi:MAG: DVUA0089 family protein [Thiotrichales bacterium]
MKSLPLRFKRVALGALLPALFCGTAFAFPVNDLEPNDTLATAQNINASFSTGFDADIGDADGNNISTSSQHVTVYGTGNGSYDYFRFTVPTAGTLGVFDIDYGMPGFDSELALWTAAGTVLAENDDHSTTAGAGGSVHNFDAFIQYLFDSAGDYIVGVARYSASATSSGWTGGVIGEGQDYRLQVALMSPVTPVPLPGAVWLFGSGLLAAIGIARKTRAG